MDGRLGIQDGRPNRPTDKQTFGQTESQTDRRVGTSKAGRVHE